MPRIIRQALGERIRRDAELKAFLGHFRRALGLPVEFVGPLGHRDSSVGSDSPLCAWLQRDAPGCRMCTRFQQTLLQAAAAHPVSRRCEAGLWELAVPMRAGGSTLGFLVTAGYAAGAADVAQVARACQALARDGIEVEPEMLADLQKRSPHLSPERQSALLALLQLLVEHLTNKITDRLAVPEARLPELVARACDIVHGEYTQRLSVPRIARRLNVSEGHLSRSFHQSTGLRFVEYIARYRAERARDSLRKTERSITDVAFACGFQSLSQFNRVFRAQFGTTPGDWRRASAAG